MISDSEIIEISEQWEAVTIELVKAVAARNYRGYRRSYSLGCKCFRKVSTYIKEHQNIGKQQRSCLLNAAQKWQSSADLIDVWKEEVKIELMNYKKKRHTNKKIQNAYSFRTSPVGLNVRRKAK
jgi:hypothetical protein